MNEKTARRRPEGYTLVELLIAVAVLGTIAMTGGRMFVKLFDFYAASKARIEIQRDLRTALDSINRNLRQADADTVNVLQEEGAPPYSKLRFVDFEGSVHTYKQYGRTLYHIEDTTTRVLTQDLEYVAFTYPQTDDNTVMSVSITLKQSTTKGRTTALQMAVSKVRIMN